MWFVVSYAVLRLWCQLCLVWLSLRIACCSSDASVQPFLPYITAGFLIRKGSTYMYVVLDSFAETRRGTYLLHVVCELQVNRPSSMSVGSITSLHCHQLLVTANWRPSQNLPYAQAIILMCTENSDATCLVRPVVTGVHRIKGSSTSCCMVEEEWHTAYGD